MPLSIYKCVYIYIYIYIYIYGSELPINNPLKYIKVHTATRWTIRPLDAPLNCDNGGLLPDAYLHLLRKKGC